MNARELIVSNCMGEWNFVNAMIAAERVVERLQNQISDLEVTSQFGIADSRAMMRERYRDRLDRMVAGLMANPTGFDAGEAAKIAVGFLAAIDAEVDKEERK